MSHLLDRLNFLQKKSLGTFADGHGELTRESRDWEEVYRNRWRHDKIVRSTHGVNCTGSCSWKIYVKSGIVTWETQQTDYPRTRPDLPNHEPRGCSRGASYSWYLYSRQPGEDAAGALAAAAGLAADARDHEPGRRPGRRSRPTRRCGRTTSQVRGKGGFVRAGLGRGDRDRGGGQRLHREEIRTRPGVRLLADPGDVDGLLRCRVALPVACSAAPACRSTTGTATCRRQVPQTWGEQTDVPESADWYNAGFLILWGSNVPQTRTPDAHFYTEARYRGAKSAWSARTIPRRRSSATSGCPPGRHRQRAGDGDGPRDPARVPPRPAGGVFRGLLPAATPTCRCWCGSTSATAGWCRDGMLRAGGLRRRARPEEQPRLEDRRHRRDDRRGSWCRTARSASAGSSTAPRRWRRPPERRRACPATRR